MKTITEIISEIEKLVQQEGTLGRSYVGVLRQGFGEQGMYFIESICDGQLQLGDDGKIYRISDRDLGFAGATKVLSVLRWMRTIGFEVNTQK
jgi:hypothetical protein